MAPSSPVAMPTVDYPLRRASERLSVALFRALREDAAHLGLNPRQAWLLIALRRTGAVPVSRLLAGSIAPASTLTGVVDALELSRLVARGAGRVDRRQVVLSLTGRGRRLSGRLEQLQRARWSRVRTRLQARKAAAAYRHAQGVGPRTGRAPRTVRRPSSRGSSPGGRP